MGSGDTPKKSQEIEMEIKTTGHEKGSRNGEGSPGDGSPSGDVAEDTRSSLLENSTDHQDSKTKCCMNLDKNKKWVAAGLVAIIAVVIVISVYGCHGIHDNDDDGEIDRSTFTQRQNFSGSFQLLQNLSSCETQGLAHLQEVLVGLYDSSPALERFFEKAETFCLRNDSAVVQYHLTFAFPEADETELKNFTLSWEMVYNVFRQYLYEQDPDKLGTMFIDPDSLKMYIVH